MFGDLFAGCEPDIVAVRHNMFQGFFERLYAVGLADQISMKRDAHDSTATLAFNKELVKVPLQNIRISIGVKAHDGIGDDVIDF